MIQINKRNIGVCILLSIITFGIYGIYWTYLLVKNTRSIQKNTDSCTGEMLCLILVPFYSLYWWYTRGEKVKIEFSEHNYNTTGNGVVYLVLAIFGLSIVSMAIMQNDFNSLKSETHSEQRITIKFSFTLLASIIAEIIMVGGYYLYEVILAKNFATPLTGIPSNLCQALIGLVAGCLLYTVLSKNKYISTFLQ